MFTLQASKQHGIAYGGNNTSGPIDVATAVNAHGGPHGRQDFESETFVAHTLRAEGFDASEDGTGRGTPLVTAFNARQYPIDADVCLPLDGDGGTNAIAFGTTQVQPAHTSGDRGGLGVGMAVRRLTPT